MKPLLNLLIAIACLVLIQGMDVDSAHSDPSIKKQAFAILNKKCNVCHQSRHRKMVFTIQNMDKHLTDINKQVFVKKRMPKGGQIALTSMEEHILATWINSNK